MASEAVVPNSTVWLMSGVPLDNTYRHSLYFATEADQRSTFLSTTSPNWIIQRFNNQMYKRVNKGTLRVAIHAEYLYQCNYMAFLNDRVDLAKYPNGKMFYAFVTEVNYISEKVTEIRYELDYIQSYLFEIEIAPCTVEREHTYTDRLYEHTVPENLGLGEYILSQNGISPGTVTLIDNQEVSMFSDMAFIVAATCMTDGADPNEFPMGTSYNIIKAGSQLQGGMPCGCYPQAFYVHDVQGDDVHNMFLRMQAYLEMIDNAGFSDGVLNIFCAPLAFWGPMAVRSYDGSAPVTHPVVINDIASLSRTGSVSTVRNKKCYTYPFNYLYAVSSDGDAYEYKYELSAYGVDNDTTGRKALHFNVSGSVNSDCELILRPVSYRDTMTVLNAQNNVDVIRCMKNPICSWNSDTYKCWLAQHKMGMIAGFATTVIDAGAGMLSAGVNSTYGIGANPGAAAGKAALNAGTSIANYLVKTCVGEMGDAKAQPNRTRGDVSGVMEIASRTYGFRFYHCRVKPEYMAVIDDYFTKFGYAVKTLKTPSIHNRLRYTYVKTLDAEIKPKSPYTETCPGDVNDAITAIYNNGITFWVNWNEVGNYSVTNTPLGDIPAQSQSA